jgi:hypothetical protein
VKRSCDWTAGTINTIIASAKLAHNAVRFTMSPPFSKKSAVLVACKSRNGRFVNGGRRQKPEAPKNQISAVRHVSDAYLPSEI